MLRGGSAQQSSCSDLRTKKTCHKVSGCRWYPPREPRGGFCTGTPRARPDNASLTDAYVRLDADYGHEDKVAESDNITPKDHLPAAEN